MSQPALRPSAKSPASAALCALAGALCAMAFYVSPDGYAGRSALPAASTDPLWTALALAVGWLFWQAFVKRGLRPRGLTLAAGLLFGVVNYFGTTLFSYDSWSYLSGARACGLALLQIAGQAAVMSAALSWIVHALCAPGRSAERRPLPPRLAPLARLYREHTTLCCAACFFACWLPYLLVFYPGTVIWDMGEMVAQFFGQRPTDTWHPVFLTWLLGGCVWLGRQLGSDNLGALLFMLLQTAAQALALGAAMRCLRRLRAGRGLQLAALCFFALVPIWGSYAQAIGKDTLYAALLLLFTLTTIRLAVEGTLPGVRAWAGYGLAALATCLTRNNGVYVVAPTALLTVLFLARGRARLRAGGALAGALALFFLFSGALLPALGVRDETASGLYAVCFQQSARALRDHGDEITPEEYAEIDLVLDAERLPELYEPWIADPVKFTFRQYGQGAQAEKQALRRYRATWFLMLQKYPQTYLESFVAGNSGYYAFTPKYEGVTYNQQTGLRFVFETYELGEDARFLHTRQPEALAKARELLAMFARGWRHIPIASFLYLCPAYTWLLVGAALALARQRRFRALVAFVPALLSLAVCLLSPVNDYFRYFLPIVAMTFPLVALAKRDATEA